MIRRIVICTDLPVNLFGQALIDAYRRGVQEIHVRSDMEHSDLCPIQEYRHIFAFRDEPPKGIVKMLAAFDGPVDTVECLLTEKAAQSVETAFPFEQFSGDQIVYGLLSKLIEKIDSCN